jgi:hypothetical protein
MTRRLSGVGKPGEGVEGPHFLQWTTERTTDEDIMPRAKKTTKKTATPKITKSDFIRQQPKGMPAAEVVKLAKKLGLDISEKYVYTTRSLDRNEAKKKVAKKKVLKKKLSKAKGRVAVKPGKEVDSDFFVPEREVEATPKPESRVKLPGGPRARNEYRRLSSEAERIDESELELYLREVCFRLGLLQVKTILRQFERRLDGGVLFPDE